MVRGSPSRSHRFVVACPGIFGFGVIHAGIPYGFRSECLLTSGDGPGCSWVDRDLSGVCMFRVRVFDSQATPDKAVFGAGELLSIRNWLRLSQASVSLVVFARTAVSRFHRRFSILLNVFRFVAFVRSAVSFMRVRAGIVFARVRFEALSGLLGFDLRFVGTERNGLMSGVEVRGATVMRVVRRLVNIAADRNCSVPSSATIKTAIAG